MSSFIKICLICIIGINRLKEKKKKKKKKKNLVVLDFSAMSGPFSRFLVIFYPLSPRTLFCFIFLMFFHSLSFL